MSGNHTSRGDGRGVSAVVAFVLLVGLVAVGSIGILLVAGGVTDATQENTENERVEQGMQQLDSDIDAVARKDTSDRRTDLDLSDTGDGAVREDNTGRIWINRTNYTTGTTDVIVDERIGAIRYTSGDQTIGIQAGGVWKEDGNGTQMVSAPGFAYETNSSGAEPTLTVPIVVMSGSERLESGEVRIRKNRSEAPTNNVTVFEGDLVTLTVQSRWYVGWADYFREIAPQGGVSVDHDRETATLRLVVPIQRKAVIAGIVSGATAETLVIDNKANINSYNSSAVSSCYRTSCMVAGETKVFAADDVELNNNVELDGDLTAGGDVRFGNPNAEVTGYASYGGTLYDDSGSPVPPGAPTPHVGEWHNDNASLVNYEPVDGIIESQANRASIRNNNSATSSISGNSLTGCSPECVLYPGTYYLDEIDLASGEKVVFETSGGEVNLVVDGEAEFTGANTDKLEVNGPGRVNIYVNSSAPGDDLYWQQSNTDLPGDRAQRLWIYMKKDADATFEGGQSDFYGVIFGPGEDGMNNGVEITVENQVWIYGALVGKVDKVGNQAHVVFDESLADAETISTSTKVPRLSFLHASLHEVCVQSTSNTSASC